jgi:hypothetical protein
MLVGLAVQGLKNYWNPRVERVLRFLKIFVNKEA